MSDGVSDPTDLLKYRAWTGNFGGPWRGTLALGRVGLGLMFRRKLFWGLYALCGLIFLFYFFGQYLQVFLERKVSEESLRTGGLFPRTVRPEVLMTSLKKALQLDGSADTFGNFIWFEGYIVVVILAFVGSILIGNDFRYGSLPFYLSKPIGKRHYLIGKALAVAVLVNLMTTVPALLLFLEYGFVDDWDYYWRERQLFLGILGYGAVLTVTLCLVLLATACWLRKTVPIIMVWTTVFILGRVMQRWLRDGLGLDENWRLIDLWNNMYLVGMWMMGKPHEELMPRNQTQPPYESAALVLVGICVGCILYLRGRIQAVDVIR